MPSSELLEKSVLSTFLFNEEAYLKFGFLLNSDYFFSGERKRLFEAFKISRSPRLLKELNPALSATVDETIENYQPGQDIETEIKILADKFHRRRIIKIAYESAKKAAEDFDCSAIDIIDSQISELSNHGFSDGRPVHIKTILPEVLDKLQKTQENNFEIATGIIDIDKIFGGFEAKEVSIIAGRPSMGKTSFALQIIRNTSIVQKKPTLLFSLEMGKEQIAGRILFSDCKASYGNALLGIKSELIKVSMGIEKVMDSEIYIDDHAGQTVSTIASKSEFFVKNYGIKAIFVDHIGFIKVKERGRSRHEELSEISKQFGSLSKKLNIPIILLCQLSREVEKRKPPIPMLSDLRESGSLEEDARKVLLLYREDYYDHESKNPNQMSVIVAKNHNGQTGIINIYSEKETMNFYPLDKNASGWGDNSQYDR